MQPTDHVVTWDEFWTAFRAHHIPEGLIERKLNEFLNLTQGTRTVIMAEPPELFRLKRTNHRYKGKMISNALQTEQPKGLSGHRPMQPRLHRIEVGYTHTR
jgi:hypothetical protein